MNKPSVVTSITFLLILLLVFSRCEKTQDNFRDKILGNWDFKYYFSEENITTGIKFSDSIFYDGEIIPGVKKDEILVRYTDQDDLTLHVDKNGIITDYCFRPSYCQGDFSSLKFFNYVWNSRVSAGGITTIYSKKILGEKKD